jgi:dihydroxy-acid dehydratase
VHDDDLIEIDAVQRTITLHVPEDEIERRRAAWKRPPLRATKGLLYKFAQRTTSAARGCVTDAKPEHP